MPKRSHTPLHTSVDITTQALQGPLEKRAHGVIISTLLFVVLAVAWAAWARVDELARGEGRVIPSSQLQVVQNLEGGIVADILVKEGDVVEAGQTLIKIDDTLFASSFAENRLRASELAVRAERLRAEIDASAELVFSAQLTAQQPELVAQERILFAQRQATQAGKDALLRAQIAQREQRLAKASENLQQARSALVLAQREVEILQPLVREGVVSEVELLRAEKAVLEHRGTESRWRFELPEVEAEIAELERKREQLTLEFRQAAQEELNTILAELPRLSTSEDALQDRVARTTVRAPLKGTVKQVMVNTIGGVVQPGMELLSIVPFEDSLLVEARVRPADIARVYPGQTARVRLSAYDFAVYGGLDAEVVHVSADSIVDEQGQHFFLVRVKTARHFMGEHAGLLPIIPGMVAQVDIMTGEKTVLAYLLKPILRARTHALTEP